MAQVTVGMLMEQPQEQPEPEELEVQRLSDSELREQLLLYGAEPGPVLPSTRRVYENKLLQLMDQSVPPCYDELEESESSENEDQKNEERNTQVIPETKDFKVTSTSASGYCKPEVPERHKKLLLPNADDSLAKIMAELEQILPEEKLPAHWTQGQKRSGDSSPQGSPKAVHRTKTAEASKDGTGEDDQDETWLSDSWSPPGIRKRSEKEDEQPPAQKTVETFKVEKEKPKVEKEKPELEKENCRAKVALQEASQSLIPMPVRVAIFAAFVFALFVYVTVEMDPHNLLIDFITGRI